jgi:hypothetical protein
MWCEKCQADVAAEASADNQRLHCATCGTEINVRAESTPATAQSTSSGSAARSKPKDPHELLARWASEELLDPNRLRPKPPPAESPAERERVGKAPRTEKPLATENARLPDDRGTGVPPVSSSSKPIESVASATMPLSPPPVLWFDGTHVASQPGPNFLRVDGIDMPVVRTLPPPTAPQPAPQPQPIQVGYILHSAEAGIPAPHMPMRVPEPPAKEKASNWVTFAGQMFAYLGVGTLTIGTVLVLMGYFGGPPNYAPTGWLVTTAGQMMLFLGVVTLISGGMEETTQEVARRIDTLGDKLLRIEQAAQSPILRGPHVIATDSQTSPDHELRELVTKLNQHLERLNRS